jgi:hypothetical protein
MRLSFIPAHACTWGAAQVSAGVKRIAALHKKLLQWMLT